MFCHNHMIQKQNNLTLGTLVEINTKLHNSKLEIEFFIIVQVARGSLSLLDHMQNLRRNQLHVAGSPSRGFLSKKVNLTLYYLIAEDHHLWSSPTNFYAKRGHIHYVLACQDALSSVFSGSCILSNHICMLYS